MHTKRVPACFGLWLWLLFYKIWLGVRYHPNRQRELTRGNKSTPEKGLNMKREDITAIFPEATEEQISSILNSHHTEVNDWKGKYNGLKGGPTAAELQAEKDKSAQLEKELNDLKNADAVRLVREKVAGAKNIPANLLTADTEEACNAQADAILAFAKPTGYPVVKDGGSAETSGKAAADAAWLSLSSQISNK